MDKKLQEKGHQIITTNERQECMRCGGTWRKAQRTGIIALGECPGPRLWRRHTNDVQIPLTATNASSSIICAGHKLHKSHHLCWKRGVTICGRCGACTQGRRVRYLIEECGGKPKSTYMQHGLRRFRNGTHPAGNAAQWPLNDDAPIPAWAVPLEQ